jgi:hypothetical protein
MRPPVVGSLRLGPAPEAMGTESAGVAGGRNRSGAKLQGVSTEQLFTPGKTQPRECMSQGSVQLVWVFVPRRESLLLWLPVCLPQSRVM